MLLIPRRWRQYVPLKHVSPSYNPTHSENTAVKFRCSLVSQSVVRRVLQKEVGCGQLWLVCACAGTYWYGFLTWHWGTVEHEAGLWRCDVMLCTGQGVVLVHVEVRCYVTYWTGGRFTHCKVGVPRSSRFSRWNTDTRLFGSSISEMHKTCPIPRHSIAVSSSGCG